MSTIDLQRQHSMGKAAARKVAEDLAARLQEKFALQWAWQGDTLQFQAPDGAAKGTKGTVEVSDTNLAVKVDLPLLLRPFKGMVEGKIREKLDGLT